MLMGCTVGPDFPKLKPPSVERYTRNNIESQTIVSATQSHTQHFVYRKDLPNKWWELFKSKELNSLISEALKNNPTVSAAKATLRQAQENYRAQTGASLPQASLNLGATPTRFAPAIYGLNFPTNDFVLYNATVNVSYALDIFGGLKRQSEGYEALASYQTYQLQAAELTLISNVTTAAFKLASLNEQIYATREIIRMQESMVTIVKRQLEVGGTSQVDVINLEKILLQTESTLPALEKSLEQTKNMLAIYLGKPPSKVDIPAFKLETFADPKKIPLLIPAKLVENRPDILAASELLHKASSDVGVATANLLPQFNLSANVGEIATQTNLTSIAGQAAVWSFGPSLVQPLLNGGTLSAKKRAAIAAYENAYANYTQIVLQGLQNVADSLHAIGSDAQTLQHQRHLYKKNMATLHITLKQFEVGGTSYSTLLNTQVLVQQSLMNLIQAQAAKLSDTAALFQALGGGWWE
jgi:NodT family efflux transporter outer membrane factor (OMF) lipoprotein